MAKDTIENRNLLVEALEESIDLLREDVARQRKVIKLLRKINSKLRKQLNYAHMNDEAFKEFCNTDVNEPEGGLPEGTF